MDPVLQRALAVGRAGNLPEAISSIRRYLAIKPTSLDGLQLLSLFLSQSNQLEQAALPLARAIELSPSTPHIHNNYATILLQLNRLKEAAAHARKAVELSPNYSIGLLTLSSSLIQTSDFIGAIDAARRGIAIDPRSAHLANNLVVALDHAGRINEALNAAEAAVRQHPAAADLHSLFLMLINYSNRTDIAAMHRRFGEVFPSAPAYRPADPNPDRTLRIGILSADFRTQSVGFFLQPLMEHCPSWAELYCFSLSPPKPDPLTTKFRGLARGWEDVGQFSPDAIADRIRKARVDVLLDLMGHTGGNRILALTSRPAPVIVTCIGYPNTTGLGAVDYRVVDSITDPSGYESHSTERLLRIDPCFLCYRPPAGAPGPVAPSPGATPTFGSFNTPTKIGSQTAALWSAALAAVPEARLVLKSKDFSDLCAHEAVLERLTAAGIRRERITIMAPTDSIEEHLALYSTVHVSLDPAPYNGTTTTCEALYMGVPVVTLLGDRHAARVSASLLTAIGHPEWIAGTPEAYARIASDLIRDTAAITRLRASLRQDMLQSPLCDAAAYATRYFSAIRDCWRRACAATSV